MSYILDALRRSQAERERGHTPGVHTPVQPQPGLFVPQPRRTRAWLALALLMAAALVWGAWRVWRPAAVPQVPVTQALPVPTAQVARAPAESPAALPEHATDAPAPEAPAQAPLRTLHPVPQPSSKTRAVRDAEPARQAHAERAKPEKPAPRQPAAPVEKSVPEAAAPVFAQADLPPAVQAQLPKLQLAGVTYSGNPKYRMVIVNGQVLHEGDLAAPGLQLERIEQGRTVWSFRGYRYALPAQ